MTGPGEDAVTQLDLTGPLPTGLTMVEASAGTGKTYALIALAVRWLLEGPGDGTERQPDQLLLVTFTRAAATELRDRLRAALRRAVRLLDAAVDAGGVDLDAVPDDWLRTVLDVDHVELRARRGRARRMLSGFDRIRVSTLHAFSRAALVQLGLRGDLVGREPAVGVSRQRDDAIRDLLVQHLVEAPDLLQHPNLVKEGRLPTLSTLEERLRTAVKVTLAHGGTRPVADGGVRLAPDVAVDPSPALVWADLVREAATELEQRLDDAAQLSFDALVARIDRVLADERIGPDAASDLRRGLRFVLVDEMQDTDGLQWRVLTRTFRDDPDRLGPAADVVVVGDPKQSIYRFRGADVGVHLRVRDEADAVFALLTNRRSSPRLLRALDLLLRGATFGDPSIRFVTVHPPDERVDAPRVADDGAPLQVRWLPRHRELGVRGAEIGADRADEAIRADLVATVTDLLGTALEERVPGSDESAVRPLRAGDIAVLVRSHGDAEAFVTALAAAGVPAVRPRAGSVLDSDATPQWRLLLTAVEAPDDARRVRSLATSWFVDVSDDELDDVAAGEVVVARLQRRCGEWRRVLESEGVLALLARLRTDPAAAAAMARSGERGLTDLEHVAELLHTETHGAAVPAGVLLRLLERLRLDAEEIEDETDDPSMRRTSTDGAAVQVMTFHGAKGLEFPVVLLPLAMKPPRSTQPYTYTEEGVGRTVDVASWYEWKGVSGADVDVVERKALAASAAEGDDARLLYVAVTRARARLVVWWAPRRGAAASAVAQLLFAPRDPVTSTLRPPPADGPWRSTPLDLKALTDDHVRSTLAGLADASQGTLDVSELPATPRRAVVLPSDGDADPGAVAVLPRSPEDPTALRWSYTAFKRRARTAGSGEDVADPEPETEPDPEGVAGPAPADLATELMGLRDDDPQDDDTTGAAPADGALLQRLPQKGPVLGELVHRILERVDASTPDLEAELVAVADRLRARSLFPDLDLDLLGRGLAAAMRTPLGPRDDDPTLVAIAAADRRHEAGFLLPFADTRTRIAASRLGPAVAAALPPDDPYRGFLADLRLTWPASHAVGWLTGSVDVVARLPDGRYAVLDHKSTTLTVPVPPATPDGRTTRRPEYGAERMHRAMRRSLLPLQGLLYLVGLHRWLGLRLAGYDPARHLGDARFLFLRGMVGPGTPVRGGVRDGVLRWNPGPEAVLVADAVLRGEVGA